MCFCQLYKCKEIIKVKWINSNSNPTNLITKSKASMALKKLSNTNYLKLQPMEWVKKNLI